MRKVREITMVLLMVISLFSVLVILNVPVVEAVNDPIWNPNGYWETPNADWIIEDGDDESYENTKIVVNADIIIEDGGKLTLDNVILQMNETASDNGDEIRVEHEVTVGELIVINGSIITTDPITAAQSPDPYEFRIDGTALIENSTVEKMKDKGDPYGYREGIEIYSNDVEIINSTVRLSGGAGVYVDKGSVSIINSDIINNNKIGIFLYNGSSNNYISGNDVLNNGGTGIAVKDSSNTNNIIINNNISNTGHGIYLYNSSKNNCTNNNVSNNGEHGFRLEYSSYNDITKNIIASNSGGFGGIWLRDNNDNNIIAGNTISSNSYYGIYIKGGCEYNNITNNTISSNNLHGIYSQGSYNNIASNNVSSNGWSGIYLQLPSFCNIIGNNISLNGENGIRLIFSSNNNFITGNNVFSNTDNGVYLTYSSNNKIGMNSIVANSDGINLTSSSNSNLITSNHLANNTNCALYMSSSNNNEIIDNDLEHSNYGAYLTSSNNNILYHNNIKNNLLNNASDDGTNQWNNGLEGNWWGNNTNPTDSDGNGICDAKFYGTGFVDNYPLANEDNDRVLVDDPWFWFIQSGVNFAELGWTVYATSSTYLENVTINKTITVIGEDRNTTIIDARGNESVVLVDSSSYVNVSGFTVRNGTYGFCLNIDSNYTYINNNIISNNNCGINVTQSSNIAIENNKISYSICGINLSSSLYTEITSNEIINNSWAGIHVADCNYTEIIENDIYNSSNDSYSGAIYIEAGSDNTEIANNTITNNKLGIYTTQSFNEIIENNTILYNNVGIVAINSSPTIQYNNISYNTNGLGNWLYSNSVISNNIITHNQNCGIGDRVYSSTTIDNNTISYNDCGIYIEENDQSNTLITYNNITFNDIGIKCEDGGNATVHWNNIHNNTECGLENKDKTIEINATNNYWGTGEDPPQEGVDYEGLVIYEPWEEEPIEEAGPG